MRLALLTFYPLDEHMAPGGIRAVSRNLVESFRAYADLEVHVVHCHADVQRDHTERRGNAMVHYLAMPRRRMIPNLLTSIGRIVGKVREVNPDLIHAHAAHYAYAGVRSGYPTIYTIHGVLPREVRIYTRTLFDRLRYGLLAYYERQALCGVRQVVAISDHVLAEYVHVGTASWVRIDNPVSPAYFQLADRAEAGRVLYVGSIDERKDLMMLLRAMEVVRERRPEAILAVAGRVNSPDYERRVGDYVSQHGLRSAVQFLGFLGLQEIMSEYERAAVVALPSLEENAPMALIEAMAAGKPVVATSVGGVPGIVSEGETGYLVPAGDHGAMAVKLCALLADGERRRDMGLRARIVARARFHADGIARRYYELYQRALGASG
jgi:glycosyltransferase involved in cell wall biosynthesis